MSCPSSVLGVSLKSAGKVWLKILGSKDASLKIYEESMIFVQSGLNQNESGENWPKWKQEKWTINNITALNIDVINLWYTQWHGPQWNAETFEWSSKHKCIIKWGFKAMLEQCAFFILSPCYSGDLSSGIYRIVAPFLHLFLLLEQLLNPWS